MSKATSIKQALDGDHFILEGPDGEPRVYDNFDEMVLMLRDQFDAKTKTVTIPKDEYLALRVTDERLRRLENGGVDDWTYYGDSLNPDGEPSISEFEEAEKERISKL